jgi:hypothetical protein
MSLASLEQCQEIYKKGVALFKTEYSLMQKCTKEMSKTCEKPGCKIGAKYQCMQALLTMRLKLLSEFNQLECWNETKKTGL